MFAVATAASSPYAALRRLAGDLAADDPSTGDRYASNTDLYSQPDLAEGTDYARRYRRHAYLDNDSAAKFPFARTTIVAPHGGAIEAGTSELCLAIAGYRPDTLAAAQPTYDYWMFEGIRTSQNTELHVTSTHCDDAVALALAAGARNALGVHGCTTDAADLPDGTRAALVGGRNATFKAHLTDALGEAGIGTVDAATRPALAGADPENIANRTLLGMGAQLEITKPLRDAMFATGKNTIALRKSNTLPLFWTFVDAVRTAIARTEAAQPVL
jgi:phage replication-related protein YjqB (UPF0714/DUF867 family)